MKQKTLLIIAGANGSGKTTFAPFLHQLYEMEESVNPDLIAGGLSLHPERVALQSGCNRSTSLKSLFGRHDKPKSRPLVR